MYMSVIPLFLFIFITYLLFAAIYVVVDNFTLQKLSILCGELKEGNVNKDVDIATYSSGPDNKKAVCKEKQNIISINTKDGDVDNTYEVTIECRQLKLPEAVENSPGIGK